MGTQQAPASCRFPSQSQAQTYCCRLNREAILQFPRQLGCQEDVIGSSDERIYPTMNKWADIKGGSYWPQPGTDAGGRGRDFKQRDFQISNGTLLWAVGTPIMESNASLIVRIVRAINIDGRLIRLFTERGIIGKKPWDHRTRKLVYSRTSLAIKITKACH